MCFLQANYLMVLNEARKGIMNRSATRERVGVSGVVREAANVIGKNTRNRKGEGGQIGVDVRTHNKGRRRSKRWKRRKERRENKPAPPR